MKNKTKDIAVMGLLFALMIVLCLTPIGAITVGPITISLLAVPVTVGTLLLGLKKGLVLGFFFGLVTFVKTFLYPSPMLAPLLLSPQHWYSPIFFIIVLFVPRLLVPTVTHFLSKLPIKQLALKYSIAAMGGSLTNTVFFLGLLYILFCRDLCVNYNIDPAGVAAMLFGVSMVNGLMEALVSAALGPVAITARRVWKLS